MHSRRASSVFSLVVLLTLGLYGLVGVILLQPDLITGLLGHDTAGHISQHFRQRHHRIHDFTFSLLIGTAAVGILAQLRTPSENVAGQLMALIPWVGLILAFVFSNAWIPFAPAPILGALTLLATILHPTGRDMLRSFGISRMNRLMLALVMIAAVPLLAFASTNIRLQRTMTNDHAALGHYGFMAAFSLTVIGVGLLASLRPDGWWLTTWVAAVLPFLFGVASVVFRDLDSSVGLAWGLAAIAWGVVLVAAARFIRRGGVNRDRSEQKEPATGPRGTLGHTDA
jgi:hypothetical protein